MLHLCIHDCVCLRKIVLLYLLIESCVLMSPTFCVSLYFTNWDWLVIPLTASIITPVKCPYMYSAIVSPLWHSRDCDTSLWTSNDYHGVPVNRLMQLVQATGLMMEEILGMHNRSVVALVQWWCITHPSPTPSVLFLSLLC
jgi:hypothetical protein